MAYHKLFFVPWCSFLHDYLVHSQERRTEEQVGQEELFRVIQLLMDKARAYTVTTPNAEFHSKASVYLDQSLPGMESVSCFWTGLIHAQ
jgi:hypothetical protein